MGLTLRFGTPSHGGTAAKKIASSQAGGTINIDYTPEPADKGTKIVFIQVMRESLEGTPVVPSVLDKGFAFQDKDTTADKFHVDYFSGEKDPYYNGDDAGLDHGQQGNALLFGPDPTRLAKMDDSPSYVDANFPAGKSKMKYEFQTAAFSAAGADQGTFYAFSAWTYEKEKGKADKLTVLASGQDPGPQFKAAVELWGKNHGFKLPKPLPAPAPSPTPTPTTKSYVVKSGDYLSKIAASFYGNGNLWPKIYDANRAVIGGNPNLIFPGQKLTIP
jgi:hypothetical protein